MKRLLASLFPGAGHVLRGKTGLGLVLLVLWFAVLISAVPDLLPLEGGGLRLSADLLMPPDVPTRFEAHPGRYLAYVLLPGIWLFGNWRMWRTRET